ncbi:MAG: adenylate/guanylate cyclase domain-containing protein [Cyclobacteriaceae bacterium]|nr:adenylate/guanylate cyclase domain-containing protein [Cyclobacteriaceae bacterium]
MKLQHRAKLSILLTDIVVWTLTMLFYVLLRFVGLWDVPFIEIEDSFNLAMIARISTVGGILLGLIYGVADIFLDRKWLRKLSFGNGLLVRGVFHLFIILAMSIVVRIRAFQFLGIEVTLDNLMGSLVGPELIMLIIYTTLVSFFMNFMRQINQKLGPGNLWKLLTGKFHRPKQEQRIFMFLDLRSSTTIAEALGHIKFSELLQDCFQDLEVVIPRQAEVYQYVGDEVILTWELPKGLHEGNCIWAFYDFQNYLKQRDDYYQQKYGISPQFKAGINLGSVTVAEVGSIKREFAFHGDTLNTAARIQEQCNAHGQSLLISESLHHELPELPGLKRKNMGAFDLKGKKQPVNVYAVETQ